MPSSKSSVDKRDVYYRKGKSDGYRARSAYKLLHLDEEFDLFRGVETAVDLCAAPGSWSQVLGQRLKPGLPSSSARVVSIDLQPMAPLPGITTLQADITVPETVPQVLDALGGRKAGLVVCDGAPDVTGVHDLDAYLHSQLLLAATTLSLTLMAPGATLIFKIFLSPLDPKASVLRSQLRTFFRSPPTDGAAGTLSATSDPEPYAEFDQDSGTEIDHIDYAVSEPVNPSPKGAGFDNFGRPGGVWVRKPRSSRKGSGEAFIICRNFDPSTIALPSDLSSESLAVLRSRIGNTLTLESLAALSDKTSAESKSWSAKKAFVGTGNLNSEVSTIHPEGKEALSVKTSAHTRQDSLASIDDAPSPVLAATYVGSPEALQPPSNSAIRCPVPLTAPQRKLFGDGTEVSDTRNPVGTPLPLPTPMPTLFDFPAAHKFSGSPLAGLYPTGFGTPNTHVYGAHHGSPQPGIQSLAAVSNLTAREHDITASTPQGDGAISPSLSTSSKTDAFFSASQRDSIPLPPPPLSSAPSRANSIGRGKPPVTRSRVVTTPMNASDNSQATSPILLHPAMPTPLRSVTGPMPSELSDNLSDAHALDRIGYVEQLQIANRSSSPPRHDSHHIAREERHGDASEMPLKEGDVLIPLPDDPTSPIRGSESTGSWRLCNPLGQGAFASVWSAEAVADASHVNPVSVAMKLVDRAACTQNQRTAISFYREVEVLRHLVHPGIVGYIAHFSTQTYHCLVLERLLGGELFTLLADVTNSKRMISPSVSDPDGYGFIRRLFGELARAVAWLHEVEVVHRDIKLENILFTVNPFALPPTESGGVPLDRLPVPLVKLSDFGLSRFIQASSPLLTTRCGSEAYTAPELVMGNLYDGRRTDAWALGVVLYALVAGELPFEDGAPPPPGLARVGSTAASTGDTSRDARRRTMHRIAKGEYGWREGMGSPGVRKVVGRLLTRDPTRRARIAQLWDEDWMRYGSGAVPPPSEPMGPASTLSAQGQRRATTMGFGSERRTSVTPHVVVDQGVLLDHEKIDEVARLDISPTS